MSRCTREFIRGKSNFDRVFNTCSTINFLCGLCTPSTLGACNIVPGVQVRWKDLYSESESRLSGVIDRFAYAPARSCSIPHFSTTRGSHPRGVTRLLVLFYFCFVVAEKNCEGACPALGACARIVVVGPCVVEVRVLVFAVDQLPPRIHPGLRGSGTGVAGLPRGRFLDCFLPQSLW